MTTRTAWNLAVGFVAAIVLGAVAIVVAQQREASAGMTAAAGATETRLADGRVLVLGGGDRSAPVATAAIVDPRTGARRILSAVLLDARTGHAATLMPDGRVLITGGIGVSGETLSSAERFDPDTESFSALVVAGAAPRAFHSATLLTDGTVLVAGGTTAGAAATGAERWSITDGVAPLQAAIASRSSHTASLLADGRVRLDGGEGPDGRRVNTIEIVDPSSGAVEVVNVIPAEAAAPTVVAASPSDQAIDVPTSATIALRVSPPIQQATATEHTVRLDGPAGTVLARLVTAEGGRLVFLHPLTPLEPDSSYVLTVDGLTDRRGLPLARSVSTFRTSRAENAAGAVDEPAWNPDALNGWRTNLPPSPWETQPPLVAEPGVTAVSGQVLTLQGVPLPGVTLSIEGDSATTDRNGQFLLRLTTAGPGSHELEIDGATANRGARTFGFFEYGLDVPAGATTTLPFTIWMPRLDTAHRVRIPSPTTSEVVVTTPFIPGLELHIPPQTVIRDHDGAVVHELSITPIPVDRPPFALPNNVDVPVYFTVQPGNAYLYTTRGGPQRARLIYPNYHNASPGELAQFWVYDPDEIGWHVYGAGTVTPNGRQVVPDAGVGIYEFSGAMMSPGFSPPLQGPRPGFLGGGDPVDVATGLFVLEKTDLYLPDVLPLALTRTYRQNDTANRPFGKGATHPYAMFLWSANQYQEADLVLPDGGRVHYLRISPGTNFQTAVFEHTVTPGRYYKSRIAWNGTGWDLTLRDGTVLVFGDNAPLQAIRDRWGNTVTVSHANGATGNITKVRSPNGRWIEFTYDASNRITQAMDNGGRTVGYTYDGSGRLWKVTDPASGVTEYTYDASHRMLTIKDARGIVYLTNHYDANGRVDLQTQADSTTYTFAYTLDGSGKVTQTDVTNPRGYLTRVTFNASSEPVSMVEAVGTSLERTTTWTRDAATNQVTRITDALGRNSDYGYDALGNVTSVTRLAGTVDAVTTTFGYESAFSQLTSVTDPLTHTTTLVRDAKGNVTSVTDPLQHQTTFTYTASGQALTVTTPAGTTTFAYDGGDVVSVTDQLGRVTTRFVDALGRVRQVTDPLGQTTSHSYDALNAITETLDTLGGTTAFTYDANRNLLTLTDALTHTTTYTYNNMDRVETRTDPLTRGESFQYDANGNPSQHTDRKSQVTTSTYDALDRLSTVSYQDGSTTSYTYDAGDRLTQIVDSVSGTITRSWDLLDRLTSETTPEGSISYTYDAAYRRATMTVAGQPQVTYGYDDANRLTSMTQGSSVVGFSYDDANRRTLLTLPNGVTTEYGYDAASQVTSLTYKLGATTLGDLTYNYDSAGNRTSVGGSWARTGLPSALVSATYDAANQIATWAGTPFTYDANGNLTNDGSKTYAWNARNQLSALIGGVSASFQYDGAGRRRAKTVSGTSTGFLHDGLNTVQELSGGSPSANILPGLRIDEWLSRTDAVGTRHFLVDVLGSTLALADGTGGLQTEYTYEPFGNTAFTGSPSANGSQFTGRENDGTGLSYYRARYLDAERQRFTSEDPIGFYSGDTNLHIYASNAPLRWLDPLGLTRCPTDDPHITAPFGEPRKAGPHSGVDYRNRLGSNVYSTDAGVVQNVISAPRGGNQIFVLNDDGSVSGYAHSNPTVAAGDRVGEGQVIGVSDGSGNVDPHLHLSYRPRPGAPRQDPVPRLPAPCNPNAPPASPTPGVQPPAGPAQPPPGSGRTPPRGPGRKR